MKTHWKKTIDKDWIGCYVLPPSGKPDDGENGSNPYAPIRAKLLRVELKKVKVKGIQQEHKVAYFGKNDHFDKPMLLSASVNLKRVSKIAGSPYIEDWGNINKEVILQAEWDKAYGGGKDWGLRIVAAKEKPELKENTANWTAVVTFVKGGGDPVDSRKKYKVSDELLKKLEDEKPKE